MDASELSDSKRTFFTSIHVEDLDHEITEKPGPVHISVVYAVMKERIRTLEISDKLFIDLRYL